MGRIVRNRDAYAFRFDILNGMEPTIALIERLQRKEIDPARGMTPSQKLRAGGDRFDDACRWIVAGIRADFPV
jgi:hypothetical protein